jgi:ATP-binding cassette, subfamily F, member 3
VSILTASGLSKHFGAQDIFENINLSVAHGDRIGLVGANGSGKTTLLRILTGAELASSGEVFRGKDLEMGYLAQEVTLGDTNDTLWEMAHAAFTELLQQAIVLRELEYAMSRIDEPTEQEKLLSKYGRLQETYDRAGGYNYEYRIRQVLTGLGFEEQEYQMPLRQLSGGQQTRAHLAQLLLRRPDMLLLDEPTNHLDVEAIEWLEDYLLSLPGAMIIVSHDRYFLDKLANRIWELSPGGMIEYRGNYSAYLQQRAHNRETQRRQYARQQEHIAREEDFIRRNIAGQRTKEAQGRRKRLERMERLQRVTTEDHIHLNLNSELRSGDLVLATHDLLVGYDHSNPLFACEDLEIRRRERVALLGPNGAGKTTFVKTILKELNPLSGRVRIGAAVEIGYFAQAHAGLRLDRSVLEELLSVQNLPLAEAHNYLARFLFRGDDIHKQIADLSGGERARIALAKLSLIGSNFLVLDEPTNHLDIPSQEVLQEVLSDYGGTILLVSHDRYFIDALATQVWALEEGQIHVTKGGYHAYMAGKEARRAAQEAESFPMQAKEAGVNARGEKKEGDNNARRKGEYRRQQALAEVESAIHATERRLAELAQQLEQASRAQAVEQVRQLGEDYQQAEEELESLFARWTALEAG